MSRRWVWPVLAVVALTTATALTWTASRTVARPSPDATTTSVTPPGTPAAAAGPTTPDGARATAAVLARTLVTAAERAAPPGMALGVAALDLDGGDLATGRDGTRPFMSASLVKLLVAVDVLDRHRAGGRPVAADDLDLITRALSASDDAAMNALWGRHDGAGAIARVASRLDLTATLPPDATDMWGDVLVSAADMVTLYRHVLRDMAPEDAAVVVAALTAAPRTAADGFRQDFGLLHDGASPQRYAKQGWIPYRPAGYLLHSAGITYDPRTGHTYAIALLTIQPNTPEPQAKAHLSTIARAALAPLAH